MLGTALVLLTLWPLVHIGLVKRYGISPWKLAGWGMYSAPRSRSLGMEVFGAPSVGGALEQLTAPAPAIRDEAGRYLERHRWLRRLVRPTALAGAIAVTHPEWREVKVVVFEPDLEPSTGMVVMSILVHRYVRGDDGITYAGEEDPRSAGLPPALLRQLGR